MCDGFLCGSVDIFKDIFVYIGMDWCGVQFVDCVYNFDDLWLICNYFQVEYIFNISVLFCLCVYGWCFVDWVCVDSNYVFIGYYCCLNYVVVVW